MTDEPTASDDVLVDLRSKQIWHDAALDITAYLDELKDTLWSEMKLYENCDQQRHAALCWVLTWLDCRGHFQEVFRIAITGCYEAQCHAVHLLHHQFAEITDEEIQAAEKMMPLVNDVTSCKAEDREVLRSELQGILDRRRRSGTVNRSIEVEQLQ